MNKQVKAALSAVKDFISGQSADAKGAEASDKDMRQVVAAELVAAMSRGEQDESGGRANEQSGEAAQDSNTIQVAQERERSKRLFMEHGYFEDAVQDLRAGQSPTERAAAARALGLAGSQRATAHLIAAMFDDDAEVRSAAGEALAQIGDPTVATTSEIESAAVEIPNLESAETAEVGEQAPTIEPDELIPPTPADAAAESAPSQGGVTDSISTFAEEQAPAPALQTATVDDATAAKEEEQLLLEEHAVRETVEQYERQLVESAALRKKAENEARWRAERESKIRREAEARRLEQEEQRKRMDEEAARRRSAEAESLASEYAARQLVEAESHRLAEEESRLRLETNRLRQAAEELAQQRRQVENARRESAEAARHAEAARARQEAETLHQNEVSRLQNEEQALRFAIEETAKRRSQLEDSRAAAEAEISSLTEERNQHLAAAEAQIQQLKQEREQLIAAESERRRAAEEFRRQAEQLKEEEEEQLRQQLDALNQLTTEIAAHRVQAEAARKKAEDDAIQLSQALARMREAEQARERAEKERLQIEAATNERVQTEQRLLDEARRRAQAEQARLEAEKRRHDEAEEQRLANLEAVHKKTELEARQRAEKEKQLHSEIDHMRIADAEVRRRIEEAETLRRTSEQAYRAAAEKVQRIEAEAHGAAQQEERMLSKLEAVRREVAAEAQARAAQEKRIKEEIEQLRRLQDEERPRIEAAILQRTAAAARLEQMRAQSAEPDAVAKESHQAAAGLISSTQAAPEAGAEELVAARDETETAKDRELPSDESSTVGEMQPAVGLYLKSVDPYKRAAAVAEMGRSQGQEAFPIIAKCFDDHAPQVRNAAARALCEIDPARTVDFFNRALDEGSEARRRNIGSAIASSGLANEAIDNLVSESREATYSALSILFVMAKTGEVQPLIRAVEQHPNQAVSQAVVKLLTLSGQAALAEAATRRRK